MSWSFISDVHIKCSGDSREEMMIAFLEKCKELKAQKIFLLGDIFDFMVGEKLEYIGHYRRFFRELANSNAQEVHFFEGNHDFHLQSVWSHFQKEYPKSPEIIYHTKGLVMMKNEKKIWLSHGDDIEIGNYGYKIYKFFIRSYCFRFFVKWLLPFDFIQRLGQEISEASRKRNKERYETFDNEEKIKNKFRISANKIAEKKRVDLVIVGHGHIKDMAKLKNCIYVNNGYVPISKCFSFIDEAGEAKHLPL